MCVAPAIDCHQLVAAASQASSLTRKLWVTAIIAMSACCGWSQAVVEGTVHLPKAKADAAPPARYQSGGVLAGPPEPATAVVYLEGTFPRSTPSNKAQMPQRNLQFVSGLLPIQKGTTVEFPNLDDGYHNVFSYSKAKRFDLGRYRKEEKPPVVTFDEPGVVKLYCEIHSHMRSTILVLDTPYFTRTDTNGNYRLPSLPSGTYKLKAWIDEKAIEEKQVTLESGKTVRVDFKK